MVTKTEAIGNFLRKRGEADLAALYNPGMEVQVNVAADGGERTDGLFKGRQFFAYQDGYETWKSFRIPFNASSDPNYTDTVLKFDFAKHVEAIGMTGWDWENKVSRWVAFDFDSIIGHVGGRGENMSPDELLRVREAAEQLPYVTVRNSTSGTGLHLYVFFENPPETNNHTEHAALAKGILAQMSAEVGFDFNSKVDVVGSNMWVWHRKYEESEDGLKLIKRGENLQELPSEWKAYIEVVKNRRSFAKPDNLTDEEDSEITNESSKHIRESLDKDHKRIIKALEKKNFWTYWNQDRGCLITHTIALKEVHTELELTGIFETNSSGSTTHNCFCLPGAKGSWRVERFAGARETDSWSEENGHTYCMYNAPPTIRAAATYSKGVESPKGGYTFRTVKDAIEAAKRLGITIDVPPEILNYSSTFEELNDGRLLVKIQAQGNQNVLEGWGSEKGCWHRIFSKPTKSESSITEFDDFLRYMTTESGKEAGWAYMTPAKEWLFPGSKDTIKDALRHRGYKLNDIQDALGQCVNNPWRYVNAPFEDEYPGNRQWNYYGSKLKYPVKGYDEDLKYPTWKKILTHIGRNLDPSVQTDRWCKENGVTTGADYLMLWCAYMFQRPYQRMPYLFIYSPAQHTGKTTFHEALGELIYSRSSQYKGYVRADKSLQDKFNGQLEHAVLCAIEEIDLSAHKDIYNLIKEYTTAQYLSIRGLYAPTTEVQNTTRWIQTANRLSYLPIEPGDTRVVVILVDPIPESDLMGVNDMRARLRAEASDFITELIHIELPPAPNGRMGLPVLSTPEKRRAEKSKQNALDEFLRDRCYTVPGQCISLNDFYEEFIRSLDNDEKSSWLKSAIKKAMPQELYPYGKIKSTGLMGFGNLSLDPKAPRTETLHTNEAGYLDTRFGT